MSKKKLKHITFRYIREKGANIELSIVYSDIADTNFDNSIYMSKREAKALRDFLNKEVK